MIQFLKLTIKLAKNLQINQTILPGYDNLSALDMRHASSNGSAPAVL